MLCCAVLVPTHRRAAGNLSSGAAFTSLAFSADGTLLFAGGRSKYVCVYDVAERVLLRRFQVCPCVELTITEYSQHKLIHMGQRACRQRRQSGSCLVQEAVTAKHKHDTWK